MRQPLQKLRFFHPRKLLVQEHTLRQVLGTLRTKDIRSRERRKEKVRERE